MGGGGLSSEPETLPLERYIVAQTRRRHPAVCFLPTATGESDAYVAKFYDAFTRIGCRPAVVRLFARTPDLRRILLNQDIIYVGGGNTKSMLAVWREWGIPRLLRRAWNSGIVLAGISAGAICWFDVGVTDSYADRLRALPCLGFLPGTCCPHYDGEKERRPSLHRLLSRGDVPAAIALDDGAAAHFVGRRLHRVVVSRAGAEGYRVLSRRDRIVETALPSVRI
jgi:peptidase E